MFILSSFTVYAQTFVQEENLFWYFKMDEASGNLTSEIGNRGLSPSGTPTFQVGTAAAGSNFAVDYDLTSEHIGGDWNELIGLTDFTCSIWVNHTGTSAQAWFSKCDLAGCSNDAIFMGASEIVTRTDGGDCSPFGISPNNNVWENWIIMRNSTGRIIFQNAVVVSTDLTCSGVTLNGGNADVVIGGAEFGQSSNATIDEIACWNSSLTTAQISTIFNTGVEIVDSTPPTILHNTTDNTSFLEDINFNLDYTPSDLSDISQCNLFNNVSGSFIVVANDTNVSNNNLNSFTINVPTGDLTYLYGISCNDTVGNVGFSINQTFFISLVPITIPPPDEPSHTVRDNILILYLFWAIWLFLVAMGFRYAQRDLLFFAGIMGVMLSVASIRVLAVHILLRLFWIAIAFISALLIAISLRQGSGKKDSL